ncbi:glycosyltransferase involved in cell wall biosynthesis [Agromyces cerinus]|uniref:hypothetical protein n=1 Tax=Agromyces cerinus TaxID=33878 RepID=UPI00195CA907|nr:hypothetical protein [Agromyces cerinus]MBM7830023.1 glycosyltransferase involved in cell wall biosynthesis [Agromyces cerinus]
MNDAAFTAHRLLKVAARHGEPWSFYPRAVADPSWTGISGRARFAGRGAAWVAGLARRAAGVDLLHVHSGAMLKHTRLVPKRFVLHLHGTDIRTLQYEPAWRDSVLWGVRSAAAVLYSTPDLAEHVLPHRPDAVYFPVPIDLGSLPVHPDRPEPRVFFASRWEDVKGLEAQLAIARRLVTETDAAVAVTGLDWGPGADAARSAGVELVPRMPYDAYVRYMAESSVVVGQSAGILSSSELEAIGTGVPVVAPLVPGYYPDAPPIGGGADAWGRPDAVTDAALVALRHPVSTSGAAWIARTHDAELGYRTLADLYPRLLDRAGARPIP